MVAWQLHVLGHDDNNEEDVHVALRVHVAFHIVHFHCHLSHVAVYTSQLEGQLTAFQYVVHVLQLSVFGHHQLAGHVVGTQADELVDHFHAVVYHAAHAVQLDVLQ